MSNCLPSNSTDLLSEQVSALPEVRLAYLFGSRARDLARPDSDLDIAVLVDDELVECANGVNRTLRKLYGRLSGEISSTLLDIVLLNKAPVLLRHRVLKDGALLYARSEVERIRFAFSTIREYCDMEPSLAEHRRQRIARLKQGRTDHGRSGDILQTARSV